MFVLGYQHKEHLTMEEIRERLELTEDEAFALLALAMTSEMALDKDSEKAVKKLVDYCKRHQRHHSCEPARDLELIGAG